MDGRILIGFNGSVESILCGVLLKAQGYQVVACFINLWQDPEKNKTKLLKKPKHTFVSRCSKQKDVEKLKKVCEKHGFSFIEEDQSEQFLNTVIDPFIHNALQAKKVIPCIGCNSSINFKVLLKKAEELNCTHVATGHFARIENDLLSGEIRLMRPMIAELDQSYFLFQLSQEQLKKIIFPLGSLTKTMITKLLISLKMESEMDFIPKEVCFQKPADFVHFLVERSPNNLRPIGQIRDKEGDFLGEHKGLFCYSIGDKANSFLEVDMKEALYVVSYDRKDQTLIVGKEKDLYKIKALLRELNWVKPHHFIQSVYCHARIAPRGELFPCVVHIYENNTAEIEFAAPVKPLQIGAPIVFYQKDQMIGGAFIQEVFEFEFPKEVEKEEENEFKF